MSVPDHSLGRRVQCPRCEYVFRYTGQTDVLLGRVRPRPTATFTSPVSAGVAMAAPAAAAVAAPFVARAMPVTPKPVEPIAPLAMPAALATPDVHEPKFEMLADDIQTMPVIDLPEMPQILLDQLKLPSPREPDMIEVDDASLELEMFHATPTETSLPDVSEAEIEALFLAEEPDVTPVESLLETPRRRATFNPKTTPNLELPPVPPSDHDAEEVADLDILEEIDTLEPIEDLHEMTDLVVDDLEFPEITEAEPDLNPIDLAPLSVETAPVPPPAPVSDVTEIPADASVTDDAAFEAAMAAEFAAIDEATESLAIEEPIAANLAAVHEAEPIVEFEELEMADFEPADAAIALPAEPVEIVDEIHEITEAEPKSPKLAIDWSDPPTTEPAAVQPVVEPDIATAEPAVAEPIELDAFEEIDLDIAAPVEAEPVEAAPVEPEMAEPVELGEGDLELAELDLIDLELAEEEPVAPVANPLVAAEEPLELNIDAVLAEYFEPPPEAAPQASPVLAAPVARPAHVVQGAPVAMAAPVAAAVPFTGAFAAPLATAVPVTGVPVAGVIKAATVPNAAPVAAPSLAAPVAAPVIVNEAPIAPPTPAQAPIDDADLEALFQQAMSGSEQLPTPTETAPQTPADDVVAEAEPAEYEIAEIEEFLDDPEPLAEPADEPVAEIATVELASEELVAQEVVEEIPIEELAESIDADIDLADLFKDDPAAPTEGAPADPDEIIEDIGFLFEDSPPDKN